MTPAELSRWLAEPDATRLANALSALAPDDVFALALRGELARRRGDAAEAIACLDAAADALPEVRALQHAAALAQVAAGDARRARARWLAQLARDPADPVVRYQIASSWHDQGDYAQAAQWYETQVAHHPAFAAAWLDLGRVRSALGDDDAALRAFDRAHALRPQDPVPLRLSAAVSGRRADLPDAIARLTRAIAVSPHDAGARFARAAHASSLGLHAEAVEDLKAAIALAPHDAAGHSALLLELHYDESLASVETMRAEHERWNALHGVAAPSPMRTARRHPKIRVGYLSPRFGDPPLQALLRPVLEAHDRSVFEIFAYAAHPATNATTIRAAVDGWRDLPEDDNEAERLIRCDDCDLLVDLAGHAPGNRLPLLARRPAARQATWLDYFDTTGVPAIDFLIGDAWHTPPEHAERFAERLVLMPHARFAYRAPLPVQAPTPRPARPVTFGSFNRHAKISEPVVDAWTAILRALPDATLALRASAYRSANTVVDVRARWRARGMPVDRVRWLPFVTLEAMHASYDDIDIVLDTFPFNGGVTTCDALVHQRPVVTLAGERMISRQGMALLHAAGRPRWIAESIDAYVETAVHLAREVASRGSRRVEADVSSSALFDVPGFTRALERAFMAMLDAGASREPIVIPCEGAAGDRR